MNFDHIHPLILPLVPSTLELPTSWPPFLCLPIILSSVSTTLMCLSVWSWGMTSTHIPKGEWFSPPNGYQVPMSPPLGMEPPSHPCWVADWLGLVHRTTAVVSWCSNSHAMSRNQHHSSDICQLLHSFRPLFQDVPWVLDRERLMKIIRSQLSHSWERIFNEILPKT